VQWFASKALHTFENNSAEVACADEMGILQILFHSSQPVLFSFRLGRDHTPGNKQKNRTGLQGNHAGTWGTVREKAEREAGSCKLRHTRGMPY